MFTKKGLVLLQIFEFGGRWRWCFFLVFTRGGRCPPVVTSGSSFGISTSFVLLRFRCRWSVFFLIFCVVVLPILTGVRRGIVYFSFEFPAVLFQNGRLWIIWLALYSILLMCFWTLLVLLILKWRKLWKMFWLVTILTTTLCVRKLHYIFFFMQPRIMVVSHLIYWF